MKQFVAGVALVAQQEFRLRLRNGRWQWVLGIWFLLALGFFVLLDLAVGNIELDNPGTPLFGGLMLFVLTLALLVVPSISSQSINGDRERGTLAIVQVTLLSPTQIAIGKLVAAWGTSLVFLAATVPMVIWAMAVGGAPVLSVARAFCVVAFIFGVICAVSLAMSAIFARSAVSVVMSYLFVFALSAGTVILFSVAVLSTNESKEVTYQTPFGEGEYTYTETVSHPERVWWVLAANPYVMLSDAAPTLPPERNDFTGELEPATSDPLGVIQFLARQSRLENFGNNSSADIETETTAPAIPPLWPTGLAINLVILAGSVWITSRRLSTPVEKLPKGVRIA